MNKQEITLQIKLKKRSVQTTEYDKSALAVLSYLFYERIRILEIEGLKNNTPVLAVQQALRNLRDEIVDFIQSNPYSFVEIVILEDKCDDIQNAKLTITIKNFKHFIENRTPSYWKLVINHNWNKFDRYQVSLDGEYLIPK